MSERLITLILVILVMGCDWVLVGGRDAVMGVWMV